MEKFFYLSDFIEKNEEKKILFLLYEFFEKRRINPGKKNLISHEKTLLSKRNNF